MHPYNLSKLLTGLLLGALASAVQAAVVSDPTGTVKGRAPTVSVSAVTNDSIPQLSNLPGVGDKLKFTYSFSDADGDVESGTLIEWLRNGVVISGETGDTYTTVPADGDQDLAARVTPRTSSVETDPASGVPVTSPVIGVGVYSTGNFLAPDTTVRNWTDADSYCRSQGARLPTKDELQQLFVSATSSPTFSPHPGYTTNVEMCLRHGWPMSGQCGGSNSYYWSSTPLGAGHHYGVDLNLGKALSPYDSTPSQVACVR